MARMGDDEPDEATRALAEYYDTHCTVTGGLITPDGQPVVPVARWVDRLGLVPPAAAALAELVKLTGQSETDAINSAITTALDVAKILVHRDPEIFVRGRGLPRRRLVVTLAREAEEAEARADAEERGEIEPLPAKRWRKPADEPDDGAGHDCDETCG
jgi:hypothetical protein